MMPPTDERERLERLLSVVQALVQDSEAPAGLSENPAAWLARTGLPEADVAALVEIGAKRLLLYRKLVRRGLTTAIREEIPRTAERLGPLFDEYVTRFCDEELPRSHYLRDVGFEFVDWARERWRVDENVASYIEDLARHELSAFRVAGAPGQVERARKGGEVSLDSRITFDVAVHLVRYEHRVHELSEALSARDVPAREPVALLVYRDEQHEVRYLELTPLAAAIVERLLGRQTLRAAVVASAVEQGIPLGAAVLEGTTRLLADLGERGAIRGVEPSGADGQSAKGGGE